jgi:hypothetical protein
MNDTKYKAACGLEKVITADRLREMFPRKDAAPMQVLILMAWNGDERAETEAVRTDKVYNDACLTCPHLTAKMEHVWPHGNVPADQMATVRLRFCKTFMRAGSV